jgi:TctA family transporter
MVKILAGTGTIVVFRSNGFFNENTAERLLPALPFFLLISVIILLYLLAIFLFRNRSLQARICRLNILLLSGSVGLLAYYIIHVYKLVDADSMTAKITVLFPVITIVLTWLAIRGIVKDEALVRSVDKIR